MRLRDYQIEAVDRTWDVLGGQDRSALTVLPTGTGKTVCFATLAARWQQERQGSVLILAHRRELIEQAADKFHRVAGFHPAVEMADRRAHSVDLYDGPGVVVGCTATMKGRRLAKWPADAFGLIIVDEAHHATSAGYRAIFDQFPGAKIVGVTATPDRGDKTPLGEVFGRVSYTLEILHAIDLGWLVPVDQKFVHVESIDLSQVGTNWKGDDLDESALARVMQIDENVHRIARPTFERSEGRPTLVFATSVSHAKQIADVLNSYRSGCAAYVASYRIEDDGSQGPYPPQDRLQHVDDFRAGRLPFLVNCGVFLEGFDAPPTAVVAMARPTTSRALYAQCLGRGTRPLDGVVDPWPTADERKAAIAASAKPKMLALDFVGNSGKHKLVYADDILFPNESEKVRDKARQAFRQSDGGEDVEKAVKQARQDVEHERQVAVRELDTVRRKLASRLLADFHLVDVDPFGGGQVTPTVRQERSEPGPSKKQVGYVLHLGRMLGKRYQYDDIAAMTRRQVQGMIGTLQKKLRTEAT